ncbi:MAG TPA: hypothetical protein VK789_19345 [Bryobacteraceae bacterium]|jgi:hypothetical protein|nr:hypothetical protein [Bryobacteraceae bacterium]
MADRVDASEGEMHDAAAFCIGQGGAFRLKRRADMYTGTIAGLLPALGAEL